MKLFNYSICMISLCAISQCTTSSQGDTANVSVEDIIGTWRNLSLSVTYLENDSLFEVPEGQWEEILQIKPIVTTYAPNHKYRSEYYALNDSLLFTSSGRWELDDDTLYLTGNGKTTGYHFSFDGKVGIFNGRLDWDEDGEANEFYSGRQIKSEYEWPTAKQMVGKWQSETLKVVQQTHKGTDKTVEIGVNPDNYLETTGLKTAIIEFYDNGRYREDYIGPDGQAAYSQSGYWHIMEDTIVLSIYKPLKNQSVQRYHLSIQENRGIFTSLMDYDGDGAADDRFQGVSVKISD